METDIIYKPIGFIKTPFEKAAEMPVQPQGATGIEGVIELNAEYVAGLSDLDGFSHLILLYHFHRVKGYKLHVVPFMDDKPHGIFATRSPVRPNPIGISIVKLCKVEDNRVFFEGADMINGSPLVDIKPFFPKYDNQQNVRGGWLEAKGDIDITKVKSDSRFDTDKNPGFNRCK
ncbi:MAG TPA: tRNA (N6-threonylcarbamoyladenosine(37)-N6)-methyltransferase TrmO [Bacteroidales bacterium]|nr:tRNA (N6-threonylcarbamoyladenosine(37)-N6)-methyltransferase TrmO [Bacteroidales bacterium]